MGNIIDDEMELAMNQAIRESRETKKCTGCRHYDEVYGSCDCKEACVRGDHWQPRDKVIHQPSKEAEMKENSKPFAHTDKKAQDSQTVDHPEHYTSSPARCRNCGQPIECIDITRHLNFCMGNAVKYLWRVDLKTDAIEDLRKAMKYIEFEIERRTK